MLLAGDLMITELLASNNSTLADEDGDYSDWLEIHNPGTSAVNLNGHYLTDDPTNLTAWQFPDVTLEQGGFLTLFASMKDRDDPVGELHTNFNLAADGEFVAIVDPDGTTILHEYNEFPEQFADISYGLVQNANELIVASAPASYLIPTIGDAALGSTWTELAFDDQNWTGANSTPESSVVLTELGTGSLDFIEIQQVSAESLDTTGWVVAINDAQFGNINDVDAQLWNLPTSLDPDDILYRTDDIADNYWGAPIQWTTDGSGWAMIVDDMGAVIDFVVWGYSAGEVGTMSVNINGFVVTPDQSWTGNPIVASGTESNSLQRVGNTDDHNATDFAFASPQSLGTQNNSLISPFSGLNTDLVTTGIGFGLHEPGFQVRQIDVNGGNNGTLGSVTEARNVLAGTVTPGDYNIALDIAAVAPRIDFGGGGGTFPSTSPYLNGYSGTGASDFAMSATATVTIPVGDWTIGFGSDDGGYLQLAGVNFFGESNTNADASGDDNIVYNRTRGHGWTSARLTVTGSPLTTTFDAMFFERGGGDSWEVAIRSGHGNSSFVSGGTILEDGSLGWSVFTPTSVGVSTDVQSELQGVNSSLWARIPFQVDDPAAFDSLELSLQYNDGAVVYLNGQPVASRNAPVSLEWNSNATAERTPAETATFEVINVSSSLPLLVAGENVLAIHGMNVTSSDGSFFILPELSGVTTSPIPRYFATPSPGALNQAGFLDFVADTRFNVDRGFFDATFDLEITTNTVGATVIYTTDGSIPTETNGTAYAAPITIDETTVIRAAAFKTGFEPSNVDTQTYFFLGDIVTQTHADAVAAGFPNGNVNGQVLDYGIDTDISGHATWGPQLEGALTAIPSLSLVTDVDNLFDSSSGIIVNAQQHGRDWERAASIELIDPNGLETGFQSNTGIRIRGGFSRSDNNPKHALRLFFREEYGDDKLRYPLFGAEGVEKYDKIDLRTSNNYSWSFQGDNKNTMNRDVFSRDTQREMGQTYTRSRYYHLYLNGQYWGIYQTQERADASFGANHIGGEKDNWDTIKSAGSSQGYTIEATDGNLDAWEVLWNLSNQIPYAANQDGSYALYQQAQGNNPDGTRNLSYPVLLDVDNLAEYMLVILYTGNKDAPISNFLSNTRVNNWYGIRDRTGDDPFLFFAHDSEHTLLTSDLGIDRNGPWHAGDQLQYSSPQWIHQQLLSVDEYRMRFADIAHKHMFNGGLLSPEGASQTFQARADEIELAIIAESARWGDSKTSTPKTKDTWQAEINNILNNYFPHRGSNVIAQFRNADRYADSLSGANSYVPSPLYPSIDAPSFNQHGGQVASGFEVTMSANTALVYYTLDGTDPRLTGGAISPTALSYDPISAPPLPIGDTTLIRSRGFETGEWSAMNEAQFSVNPSADASTLGITEVNYNPHDPLLQFGELDVDNDKFEFIELQNIGDVTIDLTGVRFVESLVNTDVEGMEFTFPAATLAPGEFILVVEDELAFESRYGTGLNVAGEWSGGLSNNGEQLTLLAADDAMIKQFAYNDTNSWPGRADGNSSSLEVLDVSGDYNTGDNWQSSVDFGGSPATSGRAADERVVINEILAHTDAPDVDSVELYNTTGGDIDISHWYLSDNNSDYLRYSITDPTSIGANAYRVFDETDFNPGLGTLPNDFSLSSFGEEVWLIAADATTEKPTHFVDRVKFQATLNGVSLGRLPNGDASANVVPLAETSLGSANLEHRVGELIISEVHYNPVGPDAGLEFLELYNTTAAPIDLGLWRINNAVDFDLPAGVVVASESSVVLVGFDPTIDTVVADTFRSTYGIDGSVILVGPWQATDALNDGGETIDLELQNDELELGETEFEYILIDRVDYNNNSPWPTTPGGSGDSLQRNAPTEYGNEASNWFADQPTPGSGFASEPATAPLDFNEDGNVDASTDGNQILVVLFGLPDANLTPFRGATPLTNVEIAANIQQLRDNLVLDVNADGAVDASTDGNLVLVVLFGLPDGNLTPFRGSTALSNAQIKQNILDLTAVSAPLVAASVAVAEPEVTVVSEMPMELIIGQQTLPQKPTPVSEDDEDEVSLLGLFEHVMSTENPVLPPDTGSENDALIDEIAVDVANEWEDDLDELWWEQESDPFF